MSDPAAAYRWALVALLDGSVVGADEVRERTGLPLADAERVWTVYQHAMEHARPDDEDAARRLAEVPC